MPKITLVEVPRLGAFAVDRESGTSLSLGESAEVDDATVARFQGLPSGYHFEVNGAASAVQENAPEVGAGDHTDPASPAAPYAPPLAQ